MAMRVTGVLSFVVLVAVWFGLAGDAAAQCEPLVDTIRLQSSVDNAAPYVGQQVIYTIRIENTLENPPSFAPPQFEGFWRAGALPIENTEELICNVNVSVTTSRYILFPLREGELAILPGTLDFSANPVYEARTRIESNEVALAVRPLPQGAPASFTGAVGYPFFVTATVGRSTANAGDPLSLRVVIEGAGNIEQIAPPALPLGDGWQTYNQPTSVETATENQRLVGKRTFEWLVASTQAGLVTIPPIEFTYYHPDLEAYRTEATQPIELSILPSDVEAVVLDLPDVDTRTSSQPDAAVAALTLRSVPNAPVALPLSWLWWLWALPPLMFTVVLGQQVYRQRQSRNAEQTRRTQALKNARSQLAAVTRLRGDQAYRELFTIIVTYFADKWDEDPLGLNKADLSQRLDDTGLAPDVVDQVLLCLEEAEAGRYTPSRKSPPRSLIKQTLLTLIAVDAALEEA